MIKSSLNLICVVLFSILLASCASTEKETGKPIEKNKPVVKKEKTENEKAMAARGFYFTGLGNLNYVGNNQCKNFELQSHRGSINKPENSIASILHAIDNNFDVVEIDIRRLYDGHWLLHHDEKTGRESGTVDNVRREISRLRSNDVGYLRHRNMHTGQLTEYVPPFFQEAARTFARYSSPHQKLNIEIKSKISKKQSEEIEYLAFKLLPKGRYFFSSLDLQSLVYIREVNKDVYLNYIQEPAKESMVKLKNDLEKGAGSDPVYLNNQDNIASGQKYFDKRYKETRLDRPVNFAYLDKYLLSNYYYTLDIRHFNQTHQILMPAAKARGVKVATYTINGQKYHESVLKSIKNDKFLPNSVIIDSTVYGFCTQFGVPEKTPFKSEDIIAMDVYNLPLDIDIMRISELKTYSEHNLYPSLDGKLKPLTGATRQKIKNTLEVGKRQKEEDFKIEAKKKIEVDLKGGNND